MDVISFKPVDENESFRWDMEAIITNGRVHGITPAPLKDRSECPLVVATILESGPGDRQTMIQWARLTILSTHRRSGRWVDMGHAFERFVHDPIPYQPFQPNTFPLLNQEEITQVTDEILAAYEALNPDDAIIEPGPSIEHRIGEAVTRIVATGASLVIQGTPDTYIVAETFLYQDGKHLMKQVGIDNQPEESPITAKHILNAILDMTDV